MPTLTIQLSGLPPVDHILKDETVTIGRMKGNTIVIDDSSVSLYHAKITRKNGDFYLKDLNSTNGTVINGQPINEARLKDHDRVRFADVRGEFLTVTSVEEPAAPATTAKPAPQTSATVSATAPDSKAPAASKPSPLKRRVPPLIYAAGIATVAALGLVARHFFVARSDAAAKGPEISVAAAPAMNPAVVQLARALKSSDTAERLRAVKALHALSQAKEATPQLREALKDSEEEIRIWSALTLVNNKDYDKATVPVLVDGLHHQDPALRQVACLSLAVIPYNDAERDAVVPALAETAGSDDNTNVRNAAISALKIVAPEILARAASK